MLSNVGYTKYTHRMPTPDVSTALLRISRAEFHHAELWSRSEDHKINFPSIWNSTRKATKPPALYNPPHRSP